MAHVFQALFVFLPFFAAQWSLGRAALLHSGLAEGLCQFRNQFSTTKKMFSKLEEHNVKPKIPISWLKWKKCGFNNFFTLHIKTVNVVFNSIPDNNQCTPFTTNESKTKSARGIMVELRHAPDCNGHEIECVDPTISPCKPSARSGSSSIAHYLQDHAKSTQASILQTLNSESKSRSTKITIDPLWITNIIIVRGTDLSSVKQMLKNHKDVKTIRIEREFAPIKHTVESVLTELPPRSTKSKKTTNFEYWAQIMFNMKNLHKQLITGYNIVVGMIGPGVDYTHIHLKEKWRTNYGWFDANNNTEFPSDSTGAGTAYMGIVVADGNIGVAPDAKWIACKACTDEICTESASLKCAQWMLCPTKPDGTDPDCSKNPHVVTNNWGFKPEVNTIDYLDDMLDCWIQAGIVPVFPVGNHGPDCTSVLYPASSTKVIGVGMVERVKSTGNITTKVNFESSRGPPQFAQNVTKPDFAAPGAGVLSIGPNATFQVVTGTPLAAAFVAGTIALMRGQNSSLGMSDIINNLRLSSRATVVYADGQTCGEKHEDSYPNNQVGYGCINAYKAVLLKDP